MRREEWKERGKKEGRRIKGERGGGRGKFDSTKEH